MSEGIRYISEREVVAALDIRRAIDALREALTALGRDEARNVPKALATWGDGSSMHALGSVMSGRGYAGFKTWLHTKKGGGSLFSLFDAHVGTLLAVIEARALGQLRTAAISGLATQMLAPRDAGEAALIGTGPQAIMQLAALAAVQPLKRVRVFSPTEERRRAFVARVQPYYQFPVVAADSLEEALDGAEIVTLITRAAEPFVDARLLAGCRHLNAVGAILPAKAEVAQDVFGLADLVAVDDLENARRGSRELRERFGADAQSDWSAVKVLSRMLVSGESRPDNARLTVFKGMGMGLSDLAMATAVYEHACAANTGHLLPKQTRDELFQPAK